MLIQKITLGHPKVRVKAQNCSSFRKKKLPPGQNKRSQWLLRWGTRFFCFFSNFVFTCQILVGCCFGDLSWLSSCLSLRENQTDSSNTANNSVKSLNCCMLQGEKNDWGRTDKTLRDLLAVVRVHTIAIPASKWKCYLASSAEQKPHNVHTYRRTNIHTWLEAWLAGGWDCAEELANPQMVTEWPRNSHRK